MIVDLLHSHFPCSGRDLDFMFLYTVQEHSLVPRIEYYLRRAWSPLSKVKKNVVGQTNKWRRVQGLIC